MKKNGTGLKTKTRKERLALAVDWLDKFEGKRIVKGYSKHFGVDMICALMELKLLGVSIDPSYELKLRASIQLLLEQKKQFKTASKEAEMDCLFDSLKNGGFEFIAGYTDSGIPFGLPNNNLEKKGNVEEA